MKNQILASTIYKLSLSILILGNALPASAQEQKSVAQCSIDGMNASKAGNATLANRDQICPPPGVGATFCEYADYYECIINNIYSAILELESIYEGCINCTKNAPNYDPNVETAEHNCAYAGRGLYGYDEIKQQVNNNRQAYAGAVDGCEHLQSSSSMSVNDSCAPEICPEGMQPTSRQIQYTCNPTGSVFGLPKASIGNIVEQPSTVVPDKKYYSFDCIVDCVCSFPTNPSQNCGPSNLGCPDCEPIVIQARSYDGTSSTFGPIDGPAPDLRATCLDTANSIGTSCAEACQEKLPAFLNNNPPSPKPGTCHECVSSSSSMSSSSSSSTYSSEYSTSSAASSSEFSSSEYSNSSSSLSFSSSSEISISN